MVWRFSAFRITTKVFVGGSEIKRVNQTLVLKLSTEQKQKTDFHMNLWLRLRNSLRLVRRTSRCCNMWFRGPLSLRRFASASRSLSYIGQELAIESVEGKTQCLFRASWVEHVEPDCTLRGPAAFMEHRMVALKLA